MDMIDITPLCDRAASLVARMTAAAEQAFPYYGDGQHSVETEDLNAVETVATLLADIGRRCPLVPVALHAVLEEHLGHLEASLANHEDCAPEVAPQ